MPEIIKELEVSMSMKERLSYRILENHPADSRVTISKDNIVQTLSGRMGTGGGNTPMVMEMKGGDGMNSVSTVVRRLTPL